MFVLTVFDGFELSKAHGSKFFKNVQERKTTLVHKTPFFFVKNACSRTRVGVCFPLFASLDGRMKAVWFVEHFLLAQVGASP